MGALLSLPLLALPSVGTVSSVTFGVVITDTNATTTVSHIWCFVLRSGNMLRSMQCLRQVSKQVSHNIDMVANLMLTRTVAWLLVLPTPSSSSSTPYYLG